MLSTRCYGTEQASQQYADRRSESVEQNIVEVGAAAVGEVLHGLTENGQQRAEQNDLSSGMGRMPLPEQSSDPERNKQQDIQEIAGPQPGVRKYR